MAFVVTAEHIRKRYGKKEILRDISFRAESGRCIGILGANGCGKSTLLSILAGILPADSGSFKLDDINIFQKRNLQKSRIGYLPQGNPLMEELTALDNLRLWYCDRPGQLKKELSDGVLAMLGIPAFLNVPVHKMSGGMKKRLSIGCSVANRPDILLMDEPCSSLDLICKERIHNYMKEFIQSGGLILLATHEEQEIGLCDALYIMKDGVLHPQNYEGDIHKLVGQLV